MTIVSANKVGLVFGLLLGAWHLLWSLLVALHWAQPVIDFVLWMHFLKLTFVVEEFSFGRATILVAVTVAIGYVVGYCAGFLWNQMHKQRVMPSRPF